MDAHSEQRGVIRTPLHCHDCNGDFVAAINYDLNGNHVVACPRCGHQHCRVVKDGKVTGERFDSRQERIDIPRHSVWRSEQMSTSTASHFIRDRWLNHGA